MKWFVISGRFEADDIDDALAFLADHFASVAADDEPFDVSRRVQFEVKPLFGDDSYQDARG